MNMSYETYIDAISYMRTDTLRGIQLELTIVSQLTQRQRELFRQILKHDHIRNCWNLYLQEDNAEKLIEAVKEKIQENEQAINKLFGYIPKDEDTSLNFRNLPCSNPRPKNKA